jgi:hypothetical protein
VDAVCSHEDVRPERRAVLEGGHHLVPVVGRRHHPGAEPDLGAHRSSGVHELDGQGGSLHRERHGAVVQRRPQGDVAEVAARGAEHAVEPAGVADGPHAVEHAQGVERIQPVGRHRDPRALVGVGDGAPLEHGDVHPEVGCGQGDRRSGDATTDDEYAHGRSFVRSSDISIFEG